MSDVVEIGPARVKRAMAEYRAAGQRLVDAMLDESEEAGEAALPDDWAELLEAVMDAADELRAARGARR